MKIQTFLYVMFPQEDMIGYDFYLLYLYSILVLSVVHYVKVEHNIISSYIFFSVAASSCLCLERETASEWFVVKMIYC